MAEPATASATLPAAAGYRPLSLLAIVGLGFAILSVGLYLIGAEWLVLLPITAVVVSAIALHRIKRSDDALAGAGVARIGLALGLVIGLSWTTMHFTMHLILQAEASAFAQRWFECLRDGKEGLAFIATVRPGSRPAELKAEDLDPRNLRQKYPSMQGSAFDLFRALPVSELLLRGGDKITWEHKGIVSMYPEQGSYFVKHRFRVDTPELEADILVVTVSDQVDRPSGPRREWRVDLNTANIEPEGLTTKTYGLELTKARQEVFRAMNQWIHLISLAKKDEAAALLVEDKNVRGQFDLLYPAMRQGGSSTTAPILLKGKQPLVLQAQQQGKRWTLTVRGTIESGPRDVDFQTTWQNDEPSGDLSKWRLIDLKYLGDRKRMDPDMPQAPSMSKLPTKT